MLRHCNHTPAAAKVATKATVSMAISRAAPCWLIGWCLTKPV
jgi:hypothetical protein